MPIPWMVAGAAVLVLLFVVIARVVLRQEQATVSVASANATAAGPDISQMSPRESADRLFDRVMRAYEQGNNLELQFFVPMALQAYGLIGELDNDAHYHVGLIHAVSGQPDAALAHADSLELSSPRHLFVPMLRATVYRGQQDVLSLRRAYELFLDAYPDESVLNNAEYEQHRRAIDTFLTEARNVVAADR